MPHVLPAKSLPRGGKLARHLPARTNRSVSQMRRITAMMSPTPTSATESAMESGVLVAAHERAQTQPRQPK
jgi:hypothetical protein